MSSSSTLRTPRAYRRGPWARFIEGLRYGGGVGQWSWLIHRITGLGVLLFLVIHIIDTFLVVAYPAEYDFTVDIYGGVFNGTYYPPLRWLFRFAELGLIACVLFHSINGVRIVLFDFWPGASDHQRRIFWIALGVFVLIMLPVTWVVLAALAGQPGHLMHSP
jgi:succinate dehydrogenase / fumarate reductase cytochrome b subunit